MLSFSLGFARAVHRLAIFGAAEMRQARAGNQAARRFGRMINWRKQFPFGFAVVNRIVIQKLARRFFLDQRGEGNVLNQRPPARVQNGIHAVEQTQPRFVNDGARCAVLDGAS
jgi:hypothetical protein